PAPGCCSNIGPVDVGSGGAGSFLFHRGNRRAVEAGLISVDDAGLGMRWWHRWNRWPDTGNTNGPALEYRSHRPARVCWSAGDDGAAAVPVRDRNVEPSARSSCDRPPDRARRTTLRHRGATASTEDTNARHKESAPAPSAAT